MYWGCANLGYESQRHRLIGRTVTGGTGAGTQHYVFDGKNMVLAFDVNDNLTDRYLWGPAVDQVLADENYSNPTSANPTSIGNNTLWALGDNQNTVRDLVNDAGRWTNISPTRPSDSNWGSTPSSSLCPRLPLP